MRADKADFIKSVEPVFLTRLAVKLLSESSGIQSRSFIPLQAKHMRKKPDAEDLSLLEKIEQARSQKYPTEKMMFKGSEWGEFWRADITQALQRVHHFIPKEISS